MSIKIVRAVAFSVAINVDDKNIITNAPKIFEDFINCPLSLLEERLKKEKFQSLTIEDVYESL